MKPRTYIAAPFGRKPLVRELAGIMEEFGYDVQAHWLEHHYRHEGGIHNPDNAGYAEYSAGADLEDASKASVMVVLQEPHEGSHYGWLVELGIGLAVADEVFIVGPTVNVFSFLHGLLPNGCYVRRFDTVNTLIDYLGKEHRERDLF
mgnify:CR=1 FL=1